MLRLKNIEQYSSQVAPDDKYFSYQIGFLNDQLIQQISKGVVQRVDANDFYLDLIDGNDTVPRSSGSLVYTQMVDASAIASWKLAGSVSCLIPPRQTVAGHPIRGAVKVVSIKSLLESQMVLTDLSRLSAEPRYINHDCLPMDPRDGGE